MKIGIANDYHGIIVKNKIIDYLKRKNIEYINFGCDDENNKEKIDYVDYAKKLCDSIINNECEAGVLICGTGIGMSIAANKIHGIIAAKVSTPREAMLAKEHNHANVITLSEYTEDIEEIIYNFIYTEFSNEERHIRRVNKIMELN